MLVSKYFKLGRIQSTLDFLDVHVDGDIPVFIDPNALRAIDTQWGHECVALLENYFQSVLNAIQAGDDVKARSLLSALNERNEFHLGFSSGRSRGHALGPVSAEKIWKSLIKSKAAKTGALKDLEDTVLFVEGVGPDMLSDAVCNIIRGPLIHYTQEACAYYGIPLTDDIDSGPLWNSRDEKWDSTLVRLPMAKHDKLILIPKVIVRVKQSYGSDEYYRHYLMPVLQDHEKSINSALVQTVKTGRNRGRKYVTKKDLYEKYGANKLDSARLTGDHPSAFVKYKKDKRADPSRPLGHSALAELENVAPPDFKKLVEGVRKIPAGKLDSTAYENAIEKLLTALFYPSLSFPRKQHAIHNGRKRIDITYANTAPSGFFSWLAKHHPASHVFVECKNYGKEVGNPEIDQLSGRFAPSRGKFGLLVVRSLQDRDLLENRCRDTAKDGRGFILVVDDEDLATLVGERTSIVQGFNDNILHKRFQKLIN